MTVPEPWNQRLASSSAARPASTTSAGPQDVWNGAWGTRVARLFDGGHCVAQLHAHGSDARLVDVGAVDHFPSALRGATRVLTWFGRPR